MWDGESVGRGRFREGGFLRAVFTRTASKQPLFLTNLYFFLILLEYNNHKGSFNFMPVICCVLLSVFFFFFISNLRVTIVKNLPQLLRILFALHAK